jgi:hypothetical protein
MRTDPGWWTVLALLGSILAGLAGGWTAFAADGVPALGALFGGFAGAALGYFLFVVLPSPVDQVAPPVLPPGVGDTAQQRFPAAAAGLPTAPQPQVQAEAGPGVRSSGGD